MRAMVEDWTPAPSDITVNGVMVFFLLFVVKLLFGPVVEGLGVLEVTLAVG